MIVDTSALCAILFGEREREQLIELLAQAASRRSPATALVELGIVLDARGESGSAREAERVFDVFGIELQPVSVELAGLARRAHRRFGRGSGHPAKLNFGDCFSCALAKDSGEPLLFVGDDFGHTDVMVAHPL